MSAGQGLMAQQGSDKESNATHMGMTPRVPPDKVLPRAANLHAGQPAVLGPHPIDPWEGLTHGRTRRPLGRPCLLLRAGSERTDHLNHRAVTVILKMTYFIVPPSGVGRKSRCLIHLAQKFFHLSLN